MSSMLSNKILELPLNKGFRRGLIKQEHDRFVSVYYVTPDNKYLKNVSEVCDWIENEKQEDIISRRNFNFVAKKLTSHEGEFIIDYDSLPIDIRDFVIQKKKSIAPIIVTIQNDDILSTNTDNIIDAKLEMPANQKDILPIEYLSSKPERKNNSSMELELMDTAQSESLSKESEPYNNKPNGSLLMKHVSSIYKRNKTISQECKPMDMPPSESLSREPLQPESDSMDTKRECLSGEHGSPKAGPINAVSIESEPMDTFLRESLPTVNLSKESEPSGCLLTNSTPINTEESKDCAQMESEEKRITHFTESIYEKDVIGDLLRTLDLSFEYPLATVNMNNVFEVGSNCHIGRILDALDDNAEDELIESISSHCGNHCAFDNKGYPRVAFECDICLILWHTDCIGHRFATIGPLSLQICDNCYIIQESLSIELPNIFCDVDMLLHSELNSETNINCNKFAIPGKLESIFKLCQVQWTLQNKNKPKSRLIGPRKNATKEIDNSVQPGYRYYMKIFLTMDSILHALREDFIRLSYSMKDIDKMAHIFADSRCEMFMNGKEYTVCTTRVTVTDGVLIAPISNRVSKNGYALFCTYENHQDSNHDYIYRYGSLKSAMCTSNTVPDSKPNVWSLKELHKVQMKLKQKEKLKLKLNEPPNQNTIVSKIVNVSRMAGPLSNQFKVIPTSRLMMSSKSTPTITTTSSKHLSKTIIPISRIQVENYSNIKTISSFNLPKNIIPISKNQMEKFSNIIRIRKRKQEFVLENESFMATNSSMIQYHHLEDLPFVVLEKIILSRNLSTVDKLNCRRVNRALKCVVDGGRVWNKVVINPCMVTGLQAMFDFFSKRNVKKVTFQINFKEQASIDLFTSFISRLKLYPDSFHLEAVSIKLTSLKRRSCIFTLSLQDILSSNKLLKRLSVSSDDRIIITTGKLSYLRSDSLETLILKNIENIPDILHLRGDYTPKLQNIRCGDWSRLLSLNISSLTHITSLRMDFTDYVNFIDVATFAMLKSLEHLIISRPRINETLKQLLGRILQQNSIKYFRLDNEVVTKDELYSCVHFGCYFPPHIQRIYWNIYLNKYLMLSEPGLRKKISEFMPTNVKVRVRET